MKSIVGFLYVIAGFGIVVGLVWAGFGVLSTSNEVGDGTVDQQSGARSGLVLAGISFVLHLGLGQVRKRLA